MEPVVHNNSFSPVMLVDGQSVVDVFSDCMGEKTVTIDADATAHYTIIAYNSWTISIDITTMGTQSACTVAVLNLAKAPHELIVNCTATLAHSYNTVDIHMITLFGNGGNATINGNVVMNAWLQKIEGHLLEENIIVGDTVQIKTLPMLDVRSNDVIASHGARVEKVNAAKLFYLTSKGITMDDATALMIGGYIDHILQGIGKEPLQAKRKAFCLSYILNE